MKWAQRIAPAVLMAAILSALTLADSNDSNGRSQIVQQGPMTLKVSVDKGTAQVADPIQLVLELTGPQGTRVKLPKLPEQLGDFEVRASECRDDIPVGPNTEEHLWYLNATLETLTTGAVTIPAIEVQFRNADSKNTFETIRSKPIQIEIASVLEDRADPTRFRDIKDVVDVDVRPQGPRAWLIWTGAGAGIAALMALGTVLWVHRKRGPTPTAWALAQITDLEQLLTKEPEETAPIHDELVEILRDYFEFEFDVPARTQTSREFLSEVAATTGLNEKSQRRLAQLVDMADAIKFARHHVSNQQIQQSLAEARALVGECEGLAGHSPEDLPDVS